MTKLMISIYNLLFSQKLSKTAAASRSPLFTRQIRSQTAAFWDSGTFTPEKIFVFGFLAYSGK